MSTKKQRLPETKEKTKTTVQKDAQVMVSGPPIRVVYNHETYNFMYGDLGLDADPAVAGDRTVMEAVAAKLEEFTGDKVVLREHRIVRLENGNWLVTPPAVYG